MTSSVILKTLSPGDKFGKLTVLGRTEMGKKLWNCSCECGGSVQAFESHLLAGKIKSCCRKGSPNRRIDYTGKVFGYLTALKFLHKANNGSTTWEFSCICGQTIERLIKQVSSGFIKSCGCKSKELWSAAASKPTYAVLTTEAHRVHVRTAIKRDIQPYLNLDDYIRIASLPCLYCGDISTRTNKRTNESIKLNSVDRLNNEPYYTLENAVPCCFTCQRMKSTLPKDFFIEHARKVAAYSATKE